MGKISNQPLTPGPFTVFLFGVADCAALLCIFALSGCNISLNSSAADFAALLSSTFPASGIKGNITASALLTVS